MKIHILLLLIGVLLLDNATARDNPRAGQHRAAKKKVDRTHHIHPIAKSSLTIPGVGIKVFYNDTSHLLAFSNATSAIAFDCSSGTLAVFNGKEGITTIVDIKSQQVYQAKGSNSSDGVWLASQQDFKAFFQSLKSLKTITDQSKPIGKLTDSNQEVLKELNSAFSNFQIGGLDSFLGLANAAGSIPPEFLKLLLKGRNGVNIKGPLQRFVFTVQGIGRICLDVPEGFMNLVKNGANIDIGEIFDSSSISDVWLKFIEQISSHVNLSRNFGNVAKDSRTVLGVFFKFLNRDCSVTRTVGELTDPKNHNKTRDHLIGVIGRLRKIIENQNEKFHKSGAVKGVTDALKVVEQKSFMDEALHIPRSLWHFRIREAIKSVFKLIRRIISTMNPMKLVSRIVNFLAKHGIIPGMIPTNLQDLIKQVRDGKIPISAICNALKSQIQGLNPNVVGDAISGGLNLLGLGKPTTTPKPEDEESQESSSGSSTSPASTESPSTTEKPEEKSLKKLHHENHKQARLNPKVRADREKLAKERNHHVVHKS